jgi:hypothetical protein
MKVRPTVRCDLPIEDLSAGRIISIHSHLSLSTTQANCKVRYNNLTVSRILTAWTMTAYIASSVSRYDIHNGNHNYHVSNT